MWQTHILLKRYHPDDLSISQQIKRNISISNFLAVFRAVLLYVQSTLQHSPVSFDEKTLKYRWTGRAGVALMEIFLWSTDGYYTITNLNTTFWGFFWIYINVVFFTASVITVV